MSRRLSVVADDGEPAMDYGQRARRFNKARRDTYLRFLSQGLTSTDAAAQVGVDRKTVYRHRQRDPDFAEAEQFALAAVTEEVENALLMAALNGNVRAQIFWLSNRARPRWALNPDTRPVERLSVDGSLERPKTIAELKAEVYEAIDRAQAMDEALRWDPPTYDADSSDRTLTHESDQLPTDQPTAAGEAP
jgi:hypothetical protein